MMPTTCRRLYYRSSRLPRLPGGNSWQVPPPRGWTRTSFLAAKPVAFSPVCWAGGCLSSSSSSPRQMYLAGRTLQTEWPSAHCSQTEAIVDFRSCARNSALFEQRHPIVFQTCFNPAGMAECSFINRTGQS